MSDKSVDTPNAQLTAFLLDYINQTTQPGYAVLINGPWGSGKSWFVKSILEQSKTNNALQVSLYGLTASSEIDEQIFAQMHPFLASKWTRLAGRMLGGSIRATLMFDVNGDGQRDGTASVSIPTEKLAELFKDASSRVIVFDDFERCRIPSVELLGYINYFVEHTGNRVCIISNEDEVPQNNSVNGSKEEYTRTKEKVVGYTFSIETDVSAAFDAFLGEIGPNESNATAALLQRKATTLSFFVASKHRNLRSLRHLVHDFVRVHRALDEECRSCDPLVDEVLAVLAVLSYELRVGAISTNDLSTFEVDPFEKFTPRGNSGATAELELNFDRIRKKYPIDIAYANSISLTSWGMFFEKGQFRQARLSEELAASKYFASKHEEAWVNLWRWQNLNDQDFRQRVEKLTEELKSRTFVHPNEVRHAAGLLMWFTHEGLFDGKQFDVITHAQVAITRCPDFDDEVCEEERVERIFRDSDWASLVYYASEDPDFAKLTTFCIEHYKARLSQGYPGKAAELLTLMKSNFEQFHRRLILSNHEDNRYFRVPILSFVKPEDFASALIDAGGQAMHAIGQTLQKRYEFPDFAELLAGEAPWLEAVATELRRIALPNQGKPSGYLTDCLASAFTHAAATLKGHLDQEEVTAEAGS